MTAIHHITVDADDRTAAEAFYAALGLADRVRVRQPEALATGFRGFTLSLLASQPGDVDLLATTALEAGATQIKPVAKSLWGYGGVLRAPDGTIVKVATSAKKDTRPATRAIDDVVLLLGAIDVKASKRAYVDRGLAVKRSFGGKYAEFDTPGSPIKLALYGRRALAKDAGVPADDGGARGLTIGGDLGTFADPDGFPWEPSAVPAAQAA